MKMKYVSLNAAMLAVLMSVSVFSSCSDNDGEPEVEGSGVVVVENNATLQGTVQNGQTVLLSEGYNFSLNGEYIVKSGCTLKIEPGVTISAKSDDSVIDYILVEQGAKIEAIGTASSPIILTADTKEPGAWGGLHICGKAPINIGSTGKSEVGDAVYGGNDPADNSGTLRYIRLEYAGYKFTSEKECNGFTFYGVGNGTTIDHLEAYKGTDDGYEWFGGTVNAKYLLSVSNSDDSFDWTEGWSGKGQFFVAYQEAAETLGYTCDCLIEADNYDKNMDATPVSSPILANLTLIGANNNEGTRGIRLRAGTQVRLYNALVKGKEKNLTTETTQTEIFLKEGPSVLSYISMEGDINCKEGIYSSAAFTASDTHNAVNQSLDFFTNKVVGTIDGGAELSFDSFFEAAPYRGAVRPGDTWINEAWVRL